MKAAIYINLRATDAIDYNCSKYVLRATVYIARRINAT